MTARELADLLLTVPDAQVVIASVECPGEMSHAALLYDQHYAEIVEDLDQGAITDFQRPGRKAKMTSDQIDNIFTYHKPIGTQQARYETLRQLAGSLAHHLNQLCPESREKSLAITKLQEAVMWANASIAINETEAQAEPAPPAEEQRKAVEESSGVLNPAARKILDDYLHHNDPLGNWINRLK